MTLEVLQWMPLIALVLPVSALLASCSVRVRRVLPHVLWLLPWPAVVAAIAGLNAGPLVISWLPNQPMFSIDPQGALLLGTSALLWSLAGFSLPAFFPTQPLGSRFCVFWVLTMIGSLGVFLAADIFSFLICYVLVSLPAYVLIVQENSQATKKVGTIYLGFALVGEGILIMAFVLLTTQAPEAGLRISELVAAMSQNPGNQLTIALLVLGFGMKMALVPLHVWMPLTYTAAPIPVAAVLSGAAVKAGLIGLLRFLPWEGGMEDWGSLLVGVGFVGAFFGVIVGVTQSNPKTILAYSSVSQMGFLAALIGMGLINSMMGVAVMAAFYAAHHVLLKGGLFLAVGLAGITKKYRMTLVLLPAGLLGLGLAGLPLTGGFIAKLAVKAPFGDGWPAVLATLSSAGTALLMTHFLIRLAKAEVSPNTSPKASRLQISWILLVLACVFAPWILLVQLGLGSLGEAFDVATIWKSLWPVVVGGAIALGLARRGRLLDTIPCGDILGLFNPLTKLASVLGRGSERTDWFLRQWPMACLSFLLLVVILTIAACW